MLELFELARQLSVGEQQLPQVHEGTHDRDVDLNGPRAAQDARQHRNALLGKGKWLRAATATTRRATTGHRPQRSCFSASEPESKVLGKSLEVARNRLHQASRLNPVHHGQVHIQ
jgi:hypothetical protein